MPSLNAFDDAVLAEYLRLVLAAHANGRWSTSLARAEIACVIRTAARQDPALMQRVRDAIDVLNGKRTKPTTFH